jgi:hypothetical protein
MTLTLKIPKILIMQNTQACSLKHRWLRMLLMALEKSKRRKRRRRLPILKVNLMMAGSQFLRLMTMSLFLRLNKRKSFSDYSKMK